MKRTRTFAAMLVVIASACRDGTLPTSAAPESNVQASDVASYIVVLKPTSEDAKPLAQAMVAAHGGELRFVYNHALKGFAARFSSRAAQALLNNPRVLLVERDEAVKADTTQQVQVLGNSDFWGLSRIDERTPPPLQLFYQYNWFHNGAGVYAYVFDSGLDSTHVDFGGRAKNVFDAFGGSGQDCFGHGTHVAGTIGSRTWGVAKGVSLRGVRVLDCAGHGSGSTLIAGIDWVVAHHVTPAVANFSLSGDASSSINLAIQGLIDAGVFVAVAAGNDNWDACLYSPASAPNAVTVAASAWVVGNDRKADYSNWGSCVDLYAPGSLIRSTRLGGGSYAASGTSQATPHVVGAAALYKAAFGDATNATIANWLVTNATLGVITQNPAGTANRLLYKPPGL